MERNSTTIVINETTFTVTEMSARLMLPLVQVMADKPGDSSAQIEIMSACLSVNGEQIDAGALGASAYMKLMPIVMEINGLDMGKDEEGDEKKD